MRFSFLLYIFKLKLRSATKKNPSFKEYLKQNNFTLVIKTEDNKRARYFTFKDGEVISKSGDSKDAKVSLVWCDPKTAFKVMSSRDEEESMKAMTEGKLKIEGDADLALWFTGAVKQMEGA